MEAVASKTVTIAALIALSDTGGAFDGAKVMLYKAPIAPTPDTVLADLVPADFDGYAVSTAITWSDPVHMSGLAYSVLGSVKVFIATGDTTPNLIYGFAIVDAAGTGLLYVQPFDAPLAVNEAGNYIQALPTLTLQADALN